VIDAICSAVAMHIGNPGVSPANSNS
jgi:hypothetical protein